LNLVNYQMINGVGENGGELLRVVAERFRH
jgi:hypothetical protein